MSRLYVVYALENTISVVKAESKAEAFDIFVMGLMDDEYLNYFIKEFAFGDGLLSSFYYEGRGDLSNISPNEFRYRDYMQQLNEQEKEDYINSRIEKNAEIFWADEPQFASEFLQEVEKSKQADRSYAEQFSDAFLLFTIKKLILQDDWYEALDVVEIDMADTNHQVIYTRDN